MFGHGCVGHNYQSQFNNTKYGFKLQIRHEWMERCKLFVIILYIQTHEEFSHGNLVKL